MAAPIRGVFGTGSTVVYTVPRDHSFRLEMLTFTLTTDATAGIHSALVTFTDTAISQITARLWDWNEGGPSMTLYYTYGIGLRPFNCTVTSGMMIRDDLPDTILAPETQITVAGVNGSAAVIAGDTVSAVVLYGDLYSITGTIAGTVDDTPDPLLVPLEN